MSLSIESNAVYADQEFKDVVLERGRVDSAEFDECSFVNCSFVESVFQDCRFANCLFSGCDLTLVELNGSAFSSARFERCTAVGVNWTLAARPAVLLGKPLSFSGCALNHATFIGLNLKGIEIRNCAAVDVDFREADLSRADFSGTDLSKSLFGDTDLSEADLSRARNYSINPGRNTLKQAKFSLPEAMSLLHNLDIILDDDASP
jgi:fluoroquinolone resistance protein